MRIRVRAAGSPLPPVTQAAGTRMYETKKDNALKTLEKKQAKVEEINKVPTLPAPSCLAAPLRARRALCWVAPFFCCLCACSGRGS